MSAIQSAFVNLALAMASPVPALPQRAGGEGRAWTWG